MSINYLRRIYQDNDLVKHIRFWDKLTEWNFKSNPEDFLNLSGGLIILSLFVINRLVQLNIAASWLGLLFIFYISLEFCVFFHLMFRKEKILHLIQAKNVFLYRLFHLLTIEWLFRTYICFENSQFSVVFIFPSLLHMILITITYSRSSTKRTLIVFCVITTEIQLIFFSNNFSLPAHLFNVFSMMCFSFLSRKIVEAQKRSYLTEKGLEQFIRGGSILQKNTAFPIYVVSASDDLKILFSNSPGNYLYETEASPQRDLNNEEAPKSILEILYEPHRKEFQLAVNNIIKTLRLLLRKKFTQPGNQNVVDNNNPLVQVSESSKHEHGNDLSMTRSFHIVKESESLVILDDQEVEVSQKWVDVNISSIRWENEQAFLVCLKEAPPIYMRLKKAHLLSSKVNHQLFEILECFSACLLAQNTNSLKDHQWIMEKFASFSHFRLDSITFEEMMFFLSESFLIEEVSFNIRDSLLCILLGNCLSWGKGKAKRVQLKLLFDDSLNITGIGALQIIDHLVSILIGIIIEEGGVEKFQGSIEQKPGYEFAAISAEFRSFSISFEARASSTFNHSLFHCEEVSKEKILAKLYEENDKKEMSIGFHKLLLRALLNKLQGKLLTKVSKKHNRVSVELKFPLKVRADSVTGSNLGIPRKGSNEGQVKGETDGSETKNLNFSLEKILEQRFGSEMLNEAGKLVILSPPNSSMLLTWANRFSPVQKFIYDSQPVSAEKPPNPKEKAPKKNTKTVIRTIHREICDRFSKPTSPNIDEYGKPDVNILCSPIESLPQSPGTPFMFHLQESPNLRPHSSPGMYLKALSEKSDIFTGNPPKLLHTVIEDIVEEDMERDASVFRPNPSMIAHSKKEKIESSNSDIKKGAEGKAKNEEPLNILELLSFSWNRDFDDKELEKINMTNAIKKITTDFMQEILSEMANIPGDDDGDPIFSRMHSATRGDSLQRILRMGSFKSPKIVSPHKSNNLIA